MARLAFLTLALMHGPESDPRLRGFVDRTDATLTAAAGSPGFIAWIMPEKGSAWGEITRPAPFGGAEFAGRLAQTLTLWQDLETVFAFAYQGPHAEALGHRKEWTVHGEWPVYVAWWVADDHRPTWAEAYDRFERLQRQGAKPAAFSFKQAFDSQGQPYTLKREAVKGKAAQPTSDVNRLIEGYLAAWNEADGPARRRWLDKVWAANGHYTDPQSHAANRAELDAVIGGFHAGNPGAAFRLAGPVDHHHGHVRFYWQLRLANGVEVAGMDYGEVSADGQLTKIVGFF